jgi:hypothetical protein
MLPIVTTGESLCPQSKSGNSNLLTEGRKEATSTTTKTQQGVTYPAYSSLKNAVGAPGRKKPQNTNYRDTRD